MCGAKVGERARTLLANNVHEEKVYTIQNVLVKLVQVRKRLVGLAEGQVVQVNLELVQGNS